MTKTYTCGEWFGIGVGRGWKNLEGQACRVLYFYEHSNFPKFGESSEDKR